MPTQHLTYPAIDPVLFRWGFIVIRWYALAYIAGLLAGWWLIRRFVADKSLWGGRAMPSPQSIDDLLFYVALGVIVGGRLGNVLFYDPAPYLADPLAIARVWEGGMAFHGGLIGAILGVVWFCRKTGAPVLSMFDLASLVAPIGIFFVRIANFIKPELWGRPSDVYWAMVFPGSDGQPRHPSQLYEAGLEGAATFAMLMAMKAAELYDTGRPCGAEANSAKFLAARAGHDAAWQAVATHGGFGYAKEYHVERLYREAALTRLAPITEQLILSFIAEKVLELPKSY